MAEAAEEGVPPPEAATPLPEPQPGPEPEPEQLASQRAEPELRARFCEADAARGHATFRALHESNYKKLVLDKPGGTDFDWRVTLPALDGLEVAGVREPDDLNRCASQLRALDRYRSLLAARRFDELAVLVWTFGEYDLNLPEVYKDANSALICDDPVGLQIYAGFMSSINHYIEAQPAQSARVELFRGTMIGANQRISPQLLGSAGIFGQPMYVAASADQAQAATFAEDGSPIIRYIVPAGCTRCVELPAELTAFPREREWLIMPYTGMRYVGPPEQREFPALGVECGEGVRKPRLVVTFELIDEAAMPPDVPSHMMVCDAPPKPQPGLFRGAYGAEGRDPGAPLKAVALVIGIQNYEQPRRLANSLNDATAVAEKLDGMGFDVISLTDENAKDGKVDLEQMHDAIEEFVEKVDENTIALFSFMGVPQLMHASVAWSTAGLPACLLACLPQLLLLKAGAADILTGDRTVGHGAEQTEHGGMRKHYLIPQEFPKKKNLFFQAVDHHRHVLNKLEKKHPLVVVSILDCCREKADVRGGYGGGEGLKGLQFPVGTLVMYATGSGGDATDRISGSAHGAFTGELLKFIDQPGLSLLGMCTKVGEAVEAATDGEQKPDVEAGGGGLELLKFAKVSLVGKPAGQPPVSTNHPRHEDALSHTSTSAWRARVEEEKTKREEVQAAAAAQIEEEKMKREEAEVAAATATAEAEAAKLFAAVMSKSVRTAAEAHPDDNEGVPELKRCSTSQDELRARVAASEVARLSAEKEVIAAKMEIMDLKKANSGDFAKGLQAVEKSAAIEAATVSENEDTGGTAAGSVEPEPEPEPVALLSQLVDSTDFDEDMVQAVLDAVGGDRERCATLLKRHGIRMSAISQQQPAPQVMPQPQPQPQSELGQTSEKQQMLRLGFMEADIDDALAEAGSGPGRLERAVSIVLDPAGHMSREAEVQLAAKYLHTATPDHGRKKQFSQQALAQLKWQTHVGYLHKRGEHNTNWKKRYFELDNFIINYYAQPGDPEEKGSILVTQIEIQNAGPDGDYSHVFHLHSQDRIYVLAADTADEKREWMEKIARCRQIIVSEVSRIRPER
eukprot:COSAG02_NODE_164_length_32230_cov_37.505587_19_plen_1079_part_00